METTRDTMIQRLGAPPLWTGDPENLEEHYAGGHNEDSEQVETPTTVTVVLYNIVDSKDNSEAEKGDSPASLPSLTMKTQSEHRPFTSKSRGARISHPWYSEHRSSTNKSSEARSAKPWLPAVLIATSKTVKEAGDLNRLRDYSQGPNKQTSDDEINYYPVFMDPKGPGKNQHPIKDIVIKFPSQPSDHRHRGAPRSV